MHSSNNNSATTASTTASASSPQIQTYAAISKTLYKQIIKWTKETGDVPFDPIPPLTLAPPMVDKSALEHLSFLQNNNSTTSSKTQNDERLIKLLPTNTIFDSHQIIIPIEDSLSVQNTVKFIFGMNHPSTINTNTSNSTISSEEQLSILKDRTSLGFEVLKSLNQLSNTLNQRKQSRKQHMNRQNVSYHIGQIVQHKTQRWRAVITGWNKSNVNDSNSNSTSLTTKEYNMNTNEEVEYVVF